MTRFRARIAVWSILHQPVWVSESSRISVFESPTYRVHNEHESGFSTNTTPVSCTAITHNKHTSRGTKTERYNLREGERYRVTFTHLHSHPRMHVHPNTHIHSHTRVSNIQLYMHTLTYITQIQTHILHTRVYTLTHAMQICI